MADTTKRAKTTADANRSTVVGVFEDPRQAERAVSELHRAGFTDDQVGLARRDGQPASGETDTGAHTGESVATGAVAGGVLGGLLGAAAALLIPGIGPVIAGGILAASLGGAALGATAGGLLGALTSLGVPEEDARYYESEFQSGRTIVTVKAGDRSQEASGILRRHDAYDVETRPGAEAVRSADAPVVGGRPPEALRADERVLDLAEGASNARLDRKVELREEELRAHKETVQAGQVEVRKEVVTEQRTIDVPVQREEVFVERRAVGGRQATGPISETGEVIEVPVMEEQVTVEKRPVVTEEIRIGKRETQGTEQVSGTVRREEARIEREGDVRIDGERRDADARGQDHVH